MTGFLTILGRRTLNTVRDLGQIYLMVSRLFYWLFRSWPQRRVIVQQLHSVGVLSIPVVLATGAFTGMVLAVSSYYQLNRLGVQNVVGAIIFVSQVKQLGPVLVALMLAGRVGSAMTAELGTMRVTEQIDALSTMGTDPVKYLILPRFIAFLLLSPILCILSDGIGLFGGYMVSVKGLSIDNHFFWYHAQNFTGSIDIFIGLLKTVVFGGVTAIICCYKGFSTSGGAEGVGRATTDATTISFISILVMNFVLTVAFQPIETYFG